MDRFQDVAGHLTLALRTAEVLIKRGDIKSGLQSLPTSALARGLSEGKYLLGFLDECPDLLERELGTEIFAEDGIGSHKGVKQRVGAPYPDFEELIAQLLLGGLGTGIGNLASEPLGLEHRPYQPGQAMAGELLGYEGLNPVQEARSRSMPVLEVATSASVGSWHPGAAECRTGLLHS